jgi:hypothetical protein
VKPFYYGPGVWMYDHFSDVIQAASEGRTLDEVRSERLARGLQHGPEKVASDRLLQDRENAGHRDRLGLRAPSE